MSKLLALFVTLVLFAAPTVVLADHHEGDKKEHTDGDHKDGHDGDHDHDHDHDHDEKDHH